MEVTCMKLGEKVSYLKGLMDGLELDQTTKEGKVIALMADILSDMSEYFEDVQDQIDEIVEVVDSIDDDLCDIEDDLYGDEEDEDYADDEDYDFDDEDDEELYEVCCPTCGDSIQLNESMLEEGEMTCPNCGEHLEFDFDDGKYLYEIQFVYNGKEYEYELVAETGEIYKVEIDDVTVVVPSEESGSYLTAGQATEIAFADSGINEADAVLKKVKFERDHGTCVYEVEFVVNRTEYEYEINAISGAIIKKEIEGEKETDIPTGDGYVGAETAMNTAIAHSGADATAVTEKNVKLKIENGVYVYEVEFKQGGFEYEYLIDAKSGNVVSVEKALDD